MKAVESPPGVWRVDEVLITTWDAQLNPERCVKCYAKSDGEVIMLRQPEPRPWATAMHLILRPISIVATIGEYFEKSVRLGVYICERHRRRRNNLILATKCLAIVGVVLFVLNLFSYRDFFFGALGFFLCVASIDSMPIAERVLKVDHYNEKYIYFLGAGPMYLSKLPTMPMELRRFD